MANPVPQPNQGAAAGCSCQRLQESRQASGVEGMFPSVPGVGGGQGFPGASEKWLSSALWGEGFIHGHPKGKLYVVFLYPMGSSYKIALSLAMPSLKEKHLFRVPQQIIPLLLRCSLPHDGARPRGLSSLAFFGFCRLWKTRERRPRFRS